MRIVALFVCGGLAFGQRTLEYDRSVVSQVRIDARDLGYRPADVIPDGESAIAALAVAPNGVVYGLTSGARSHLFTLDPLHGYVQPLGFLTDMTAVRGTLAIAGNGDVYIGGKHLLRYRPTPDQAVRPIRIEAACETTDMGMAMEQESIYAMAADHERNLIYGLTSPSGNFFSYDIAGAKFSVLGRVAEHRIRGEKFERDRLIGRALAVDGQGDVFTSGDDGALFRYRPGASSIEKLGITLPSEPGREGYNRVEVWSAAKGGVFYGGTTDGYLFRLRPDLRVENLGKPLNQYRINGLVLARNGKFYGAGGDEDDMARLFSYDPKTGAYQVLGFIDVNRRPYYSWQAYQIGAMAIGTDGTIYLGESERKSRLYLYHPE